jgi:fumarate reductase flavoprotein subunit
MDVIPTSTDLVVIGSGVSGLCAALTAAEGGATVVVFEKQRSLGGTSNFFDGMFAVESELQRKKYITYSRDDAFKAIMEYSHWKANPRLVRAFVNESGPTITWLRNKGVEFVDATINMPDAPRCYHVVKGTGAAVVKALVTACRDAGIHIAAGTPVKRILKERGKIAGVVIEENGEEKDVAASAVVVASGGYANNAEWIRKYAGFDLDVNIFPIGNVDKMGDGIRMAWEAGGAEDGMGLLELFRVGPMAPDLPMKSHIELVAAQPDLWVDPKGERFCDEGIAFYDTSIGNANSRYKDGFTWSLFDDSIVDQVLAEGIVRSVGMDNPPGTKPVNVRREMEGAIERGSADFVAANTIEELARKTGMDPTVLSATVDEYNTYCRCGHDDLFAKNQKYLRPLKGSRFYGARCRTVFLGTLGGIKINERNEVLDKSGRVIPGLYAVGFDATGMWGDSYCIKDSSGASAGFAINSGRMAGKNAAEFLKKGRG